MIEVLVTSLFVGIPTGLAGVALGSAWDRYVTSKGWRGWHLPSMFDHEREDWNL